MFGERGALRRLAAAVHALHRDEHASRSGRIADQDIRQFLHGMRNMRCIGGNQLFFRAVAIAHADGIHAVRPAAFDIEAAVANHHDAAAECFHAPADKRRLAGILVIQPRPDHVVQIRRETKFFRDALGENLRLCGDDRHARAIFLRLRSSAGMPAYTSFSAQPTRSNRS